MRRLNKSYPYQKQLKNRSSKNLSILVGPGTKSIMRKVSNAVLEDWADREVRGALSELNRRLKKSDKKENK